VARERRVVTPDGHVWYVRRRWARRRPPWSRRSRPPLARVDADEELTAEEPVTPPVDALFTYYDSDLGEPGFDRYYDERDTLENTLLAVVVVAVAAVLAAAATVQFVLPWLLPWVAANAVPLVGAAAVAAVLVVADRLRRPWFVELQRQGLTDAPRRVWRVRGWRRSGRLMDEIATAIREGRIDSEHAAILFRQRRGGPPTGDRGGD
jgi:hypothetical protein